MTRRLVLTIVGTVMAALLVAGLGTLILARTAARRDTERSLTADTRQLAAGLDELPVVASPQTTLTARLRNLTRVLRLDGIEAVRLTFDGRVIGTQPKGAHLSPDDVGNLRAGRTVSHSSRTLAWAAVPVGKGRNDTVLIATRHVSSGVRPALGWFLLSSVIVLVLSAAVATALARRISRPVRSASQAAHRVAAGELGTRLTEPPADHTDELADLTRSINTMASSLERAQASEQQFLLSISHDLRTPLTSIRGFAEAIADGASPDPAQSASVILAEAQRLERLVGDLLQLGRLRSRQFSLQVAPVDLAAVTEKAVAGLRASVAPKQVSVQTVGAVPALVDPDRFAQVVANLVSNAGRFAHTAVTVYVTPFAGVAQVIVDDDGPGIAPHDLPYVFERMYQSQQQPARAEQGSGLGLAIVKELVEAMGGSVSAGVAPTGGARIIVTVPSA